jgi:hypothetical protein
LNSRRSPSRRFLAGQSAGRGDRLLSLAAGAHGVSSRNDAARQFPRGTSKPRCGTDRGARPERPRHPVRAALSPAMAFRPIACKTKPRLASAPASGHAGFAGPVHASSTRLGQSFRAPNRRGCRHRPALRPLTATGRAAIAGVARTVDVAARLRRTVHQHRSDHDHAVDVFVSETQTGRFMFGAGINSDAGVTGQIVIDERNFDITRFPGPVGATSSTAPRSAAPDRDSASKRCRAARSNAIWSAFTEPYLFNTPISLNLSGFLFDRRYFDWDEQRLGGRLALGYRLTHDLSLSGAIRAENVHIDDPNGSRSRSWSSAGQERAVQRPSHADSRHARHPVLSHRRPFDRTVLRAGVRHFRLPARRTGLPQVLPDPRAAGRIGTPHAGIQFPAGLQRHEHARVRELLCRWLLDASRLSFRGASPVSTGRMSGSADHSASWAPPNTCFP